MEGGDSSIMCSLTEDSCKEPTLTVSILTGELQLKSEPFELDPLEQKGKGKEKEI